MTRRHLTLASRLVLVAVTLFCMLLAALMIADACGLNIFPEGSLAHG